MDDHFAVQSSPIGVGSGSLGVVGEEEAEAEDDEDDEDDSEDSESEARAAATRKAGVRSVENFIVGVLNLSPSILFYSMRVGSKKDQGKVAL